MLLDEDVDEVLPDWAFFVSCILEADELTRRRRERPCRTTRRSDSLVRVGRT
jgi:hypothetical protein